MKKQHKSYFPIKIGADLFLLTASFLLSSFLSMKRIIPEQRFFQLETGEIILLLVLLGVWYFSSRATRLYDEFRSRTLSYELIALIKNCLIQIGASILFLFIIKTLIIHRFFIAVYFLLMVGSLGAWKIIFRKFLRWLMKRGYNLRRVIIVGAGEVGQRFAEMIDMHPQFGYRVAGFLDVRHKPDLGEFYLGTLNNLESILEANNIEEVIITLPNRMTKRINHIISVCGNFPVAVRIIPDHFELFMPKYEVSIFGSFPLITLTTNPLEELHWRILKRGFDLLLTVAIFACVFSWLWPIIALAVKLDSAGPVFFKQERWGRRNRRITCYKFRSMYKGSVETDENGRFLQASIDDPRITRVGRILRRAGLDELPQFINVLKGDMSVVGPRPHPTLLNLELRDIIRRYMLRHLVKPGITGWAQVKGLRGATTDPELMQKRIDHDLWYIENWSLWLDVRILFSTLRYFL
jgi:putative colanic acid biosynthesis UDP-glucose lipid carrier transferase